MKSLKTVQTIAEVLRILSTIARVFSFIGAIGCFLGAVILFIAERDIVDMSLFTDYVPSGTGDKLSPSFLLVADAVVCLGSGIVSAYAVKYFKNELAAGTPFTYEGAKELMYLGIKTFAYPLGSVLIASIICAVGDVEENFEIEASLGIAMILISFVFRYGAELEEKQKASAAIPPEAEESQPTSDAE